MIIFSTAKLAAVLLLSGFLPCFSAYLSAWPLKSVRSHYEPWYPVRFEIISDRLQKQLGPHFGCFYTSWSLIYKIDHSLHWFCPWYFSSYGWCWWLLFCDSYIFCRFFFICFGFWMISFCFSSSYPYLIGTTSLSKCIISLQVATSLFISAVTFTIHHSLPELRFI